MSESDFQQIKDWNKKSLILLKKEIKKSESDFQQIKDWNKLLQIPVFSCSMSESDFQQIKDWNMEWMIILKRRLVSESDFQQIKDWNWLPDRRRIYRQSGLNPTSNKSRIETDLFSFNRWKIVSVWIRLPTNQGLKPTFGIRYMAAISRLNPTSNKSRIETSNSTDDIWCDYMSESDFQQIKDWNLTIGKLYTVSFKVWIRLPTNQGLKPVTAGSPQTVTESLNPTSNKSRIETPAPILGQVCAPSGLNPTSNKSRIETP